MTAREEGSRAERLLAELRRWNGEPSAKVFRPGPGNGRTEEQKSQDRVLARFVAQPASFYQQQHGVQTEEEWAAQREKERAELAQRRKVAYGTLPDTASGMIRVGIECLKEVQKTKGRYCITTVKDHGPLWREYERSATQRPGICGVSIAGAVMAMRLHTQPGSDWRIVDWPHAVEHKLWGLKYLGEGQVERGLGRWGMGIRTRSLFVQQDLYGYISEHRAVEDLGTFPVEPLRKAGERIRGGAGPIKDMPGYLKDLKALATELEKLGG